MKAPNIISVTIFALSLAGGMQPVLADNDIPWNSLSQSEQSVLRKHQGEESSQDIGGRSGRKQVLVSIEEAQRVLGHHGIFVVVFAHKSTAAWETLTRQSRAGRTRMVWYFIGVLLDRGR